MDIQCDVLVVGAGPAGCSAARTTAESGLKTIIIEKNKEIGVPVRCAEGIANYLIPYLPFKIPKDKLTWKINGMLFGLDDFFIERTGAQWGGYSIDRKIFDKWLSSLAIKKGAELLTNCELERLEVNNGQVLFIEARLKGKVIKIIPRIVIAADGSESTVLKELGLYKPKKGDIAEVYSWEMSNLNLYRPHLEQIFTGDFTPGGYAYIFPKSRKVANIGIGGIYPRKKLETCFEEFLEMKNIKQQVRGAKWNLEKSKTAVFGDLTDKWIFGNIFLVGDAANQNLKPFIEGILPSIICGDIAGKLVIKRNFSSSDYYNSVCNCMDGIFENTKLLQYAIKDLFKKKNCYELFYGLVSDLIPFNELSKFNKATSVELKRVLNERIHK